MITHSTAKQFSMIKKVKYHSTINATSLTLVQCWSHPDYIYTMSKKWAVFRMQCIPPVFIWKPHHSLRALWMATESINRNHVSTIQYIESTQTHLMREWLCSLCTDISHCSDRLYGWTLYSLRLLSVTSLPISLSSCKTQISDHDLPDCGYREVTDVKSTGVTTYR